MSLALRRALPLLISCLLAGCSGSKGPATSPVTGTVTYKGQAVDGATVVFTPTSGRPATAITDAQGKYQLTTFAEKDGAVPGDYKVTVSKTVTEGKMPDLTQEQIGEMQMKGEPIPGPVSKNVLPEKYSNGATTDLSFTVKSGANDIPIELKD
jgi:hypothetical protein